MAKKILSLGAAALLAFNGGDALAAPREPGAEEMLFSDIPVVVDVASLFKESDLTTGSTVEQITEKEWTVRGDRSLIDALTHSPSVYGQQDLLGYLLLT